MPPTVVNIADYLKEREAEIRAARVLIMREIDPECANRAHYVIASARREAVLFEIAGLVAEVDAMANGYGHFDGPHRFAGLYYATGHVVVHPDLYVAKELDDVFARQES
jgi:hypothetical protein